MIFADGDARCLGGEQDGIPLRYVYGVSRSRPLIMAPMAEISHVAFRMLVRALGGCDLFFTEMLSSRTIVRERPDRSVSLIKDPTEGDLVHQLSGADPGIMARAAEILADRGATRLDLNLGCAAPMIVRKGEGMALMKDPAKTRQIVRAVRNRFFGHLSAKIRLGWTLDRDFFLDFCRMLEDEGVETLAVHPRLKHEKFKGRSRWDWIDLARTSISLPVVGNGDVLTTADARAMFAQTRCDAVMIGRGAVMRPWLFKDIASGPSPEPAPGPVFLDLIRLIERHLPLEKQLSRTKIFSYWFTQPLFFGHALHTAVRTAGSMPELRSRVEEFFR